MRSNFDKNLEELLNKVIGIGDQVSGQLQILKQAVNEPNLETADQILAADEAIIQAVAAVEQESYSIVALQQPVAADLRLIFALRNTSYEMRNISEHAAMVAKRIKRNKPDLSTCQSILQSVNQMMDLAQAMYAAVQHVIVDQNIQQASEIAMKDKEVDQLFVQTIDIATDQMRSNEQAVLPGIYLIDVATSVERVGDYVTNICEHIVYCQTGAMMVLN